MSVMESFPKGSGQSRAVRVSGMIVASSGARMDPGSLEGHVVTGPEARHKTHRVA